jgi:hypothetical protein
MTAAALLQGLFEGVVVAVAIATLFRVARAARRLRRGRGALPPGALPDLHAAFMPPISILLPVEEAPDVVVARVASLLELDFPEYEVVVVLDPSQEDARAALEAAFALRAFPEAHWRRLPTAAVRAIYHGARGPRLRVVEKEAGDGADALDCAVNASRFPLLCTLAPGTTLRADALLRLAEPFVEEARLRVSCAPAVEARASPGRQLLGLRGLVAGMAGAPLRALALSPRGALLLRKDAVVEARGFPRGIDPHANLVRRLSSASGLPIGGAVRFVAEPVVLRDAVHDEPKRPSLADGEAMALLAAGAGMVALWAGGAVTTAALLAFFALALALDWLASAASLALEAAYFEGLFTSSRLARLALSALSVPNARRFLPGRARPRP